MLVNEESEIRILNDPLEFIEPELHSKIDNLEERTYFLTKKEHPLIKGRMVHYLHECSMGKMFEEDGPQINRLAKWASVVFPKVFGLEIINI